MLKTIISKVVFSYFSLIIKNTEHLLIVLFFSYLFKYDFNYNSLAFDIFNFQH